MRILTIGNGWSPQQLGGLNRYVTNLTSAFAALGHDQDVLVLAPAESSVVPLTNAGPTSAPLAQRMYRFGSSARRLVRKSDVVAAHFALNTIPVLPSMGGKPLVFHFHGPWSAEARAIGQRSLKTSIKKKVERLVFRRASSFIVLSNSFADVLELEYGIARERIHVVAPGVDLERFRPSERKDPLPTAVCVRRLVPRMGIDVLLRAWAGGDVPGRLVVVGDGQERNNLRELARTLGIADRVTFTGRVDDEELASLYARAWVSVVPTLELEGFGLVALESLAAGVPVIASDSGGLTEVLGAFSPQWLVPPGDVQALGASLRAALMGDPALPTSSACQAYAAGFTWDRAAERVAAVYQLAISEAARRS